MKLFIKKHYLLILILVSSLIPFIPFYLSNDLLHTHDGLVHLPRLAAYFRALTEGHFPVRFAGYLNYGYGLPLFNFIYQTPYLIGSLLLLVGINLVNAFKLSLLLSFVISGIGMYLFGKEYFKDDRKAFIATIFYQFAPFRIVELVVRGSFGEVYTYAFFPFVLYGITLSKRKPFLGFITTGIATALLIISHNSVSLLFFAAAVLFLLVTKRRVVALVRGSVPLLVGMTISAFYWLPAILEHKYTYGNLYMENVYRDHFVPFQNFFIPNLTNISSLQTEGISTFLGIFPVIGAIFALWLLIRNRVDKKEKSSLWYGIILLSIAFLFMLPISSIVWSSPYASFLRQFQFPWRFLALTVIACAFCSVSLFSIKKFKTTPVLLIVSIITILSVVFYMRADLGYKKINEQYYWNFPLNTTYYGETDVIWSAGPAKGYPKAPIEIIGGKGTLSNVISMGTYQSFNLENSDDVSIVSNKQYFPGWRVFANNGELPIQFQDPNHRGLLVFAVPKGNNFVEIKFTENKLRMVADIISLIGLVALVPIGLVMTRNKQ